MRKSTISIALVTALACGGKSDPPPTSSTSNFCTYGYSDWTCGTNNVKTRTVLSAKPDGCNGTPILSAPCNVSTIVSINFDDGYSEIVNGAAMLEAHGMRGTFYIIDGSMGKSGYASLADVRAMQAAGHEIGGHTLTHPNLATLSDWDAQREICNDRVNLTNYGLDVQTFAFPFGGEQTPALTSSVIACGYSASRVVGPIDPTNDSVPWANNLPPTNCRGEASCWYSVMTPQSIQVTSTFADMQQLIMNAQSVGTTTNPSWLPLVFHRICDLDLSQCDKWSVSTATFNALLDWLVAQQSQGTAVETMRDIQAAEGRPPQPLLYLAHPILNPSLESVPAPTGTVPNPSPFCWERSSSASGNVAIWSTVSGTDAHSGTYAQRVDVSNYTSGFQRLLPDPRCAPPAQPGHKYRVSGWYKSSAQALWVLYYRDRNGTWTQWIKSPNLASAADWTQTTFVTPPLPANANAVNFALSIYSNGSLVMDDFDFIDLGG